MTITQIKAAADTDIRDKTSASSISPGNVADQVNNLADELLARGIATVADTTALAALSGVDFKLSLLPGTGFFQWLSSGSANGVTIFNAAGGGVWSLVSADRKVVQASGTTPTINLTEADSGKWFTNEGALADNNYNLPAPSPGLIFYAANVNNLGIMQRFTATGGASVQIGGSAGGSIVGGFGGTLGLLCVSSTRWMVIFQVNAWTLE